MTLLYTIKIPHCFEPNFGEAHEDALRQARKFLESAKGPAGGLGRTVQLQFKSATTNIEFKDNIYQWTNTIFTFELVRL